MSLRLEKNWGAWALDYRPDFTAAQAGLDVFIDWNKDFIGKAAALAERESGPDKKLVTMVIEASDSDVSNDEAVFHEGQCVGYVSSGGFAHWVQKSMALGYVPPQMAADGTRLQVEINGELCHATVTAHPLYDANGANMRT